MICISSCDRYFATSDDLQCWAARTMQTVLHVLLYVLVYRTYSILTLEKTPGTWETEGESKSRTAMFSKIKKIKSSSFFETEDVLGFVPLTHSSVIE